MSSLRLKDRASLCRSTFADGRQCLIPRSPGHPSLCSDHARKDSQAHAADKLARDLSYFFSGEYLSACDLSTALGRLIAGVARGDIKPRSARTLAYLSQTLVQAIHLAQDEYINTFGSDGWRRAVRNSVKGNHDYRFPPAPKPAAVTQPAPVAHPSQTPVNCHSERIEESAFSSNSSLATHLSPLPQAPQPAPTPHTPLPPTRSDFVQHVTAGLPPSLRPGSTGKTGGGQTPHPVEHTPRLSFRAERGTCCFPFSRVSVPSSINLAAARRNARELSFRAERASCFLIKLVTLHSPLVYPDPVGATSSTCPK